MLSTRRSVMTLFSDPADVFCHRVRIVLAEKDITAEIEDVDPGNLPEDVLHLNPYQTLPTLLDRDLVLYDSRVICDYLDERFPHPPLMPIDPVSRARTRLALHRVEHDWFPFVVQLEYGSSKEQNAARKGLHDGLCAAVELFAHTPFFLSEEMTLVDVSLAPILWRLGKWKVELPPACQPIMDYAERLFAREGFVLSLTTAERALRG